MATFEIHCGPIKATHDFYLMRSLPKQILLGMDFMTKFKVSIHPSDNCWMTDGQKYNFLPTDKITTTSLSLEAVEHIKINSPIDFNLYKLKFFNLIEEFEDIFCFRPGLAKCEPMSIDTGTAQPIQQPQRRMNEKKSKEVEEHVQEMLAEEWLVPSNSPWRANFVMVPKKGGDTRPCGDYRQLNDITKTDAYPMPDAQEVLDWLGNSKVFSTFDLTKGYFQIPIAEEDQEKTAVWSSSGLYHYRVMPFGLKNAPKVFQRLMNKILEPYLKKFMMVYLDDVIIFSNDPESHLEHLRIFFGVIRETGLTLNPKKIQPMKASIQVLGHIIEDGHRKPSPSNVEGIQKFPTPKDLTGVRKFLGTVGYYRTFIPGYTFIALPMYKLLKKEIKFLWLQEHEDAFQALKQAVLNITVALPNLNGTFVLQTDASGQGIGAVLMTVLPNGEKLPVSFISRTLQGGEKNYTTTELECLAIVWAIEKFRCYLEHTSFTVETDHMAIKWLMSIDRPQGRIARWIMKLQPFEFEVVYRPGRLNWVADGLSRYPANTVDTTEVIAAISPGDELCRISAVELIDLGLTLENIKSAQLADPLLIAVREFLITGDKPTGGKLSDKIKTVAKQSFIEGDPGSGLLYKWQNPENWDVPYMEERLILPEKFEEQIIKYYHSNNFQGHLGVEITCDRIAKQFYFIGLRTKVANFIRSCDVCQRHSYDNQKPGGFMKPHNYLFPWEEISVDLIGPLPQSKKRNVYLLVIIDIFSNWVEAFPLTATQAKSQTIIDKMMIVFCHWGFPSTIISDNGPQFISKLWNGVMASLGIKVKHTSPYNPQANPVERKNRDIKLYLAKYAEKVHNTWDENLQPMLFALRTAINRSTGYTPARLLLGKELRTPIDLIIKPKSDFTHVDYNKFADLAQIKLHNAIEYAKENRMLASEQQKLLYDKGRKLVTFKVGDLVLCKTHPLSSGIDKFAAKLAPKRDGPYVILEFQPPNTYVIGDIETNEAVTTVPVHFLRKYFAQENPQNEPETHLAGNSTGAKQVSFGKTQELPKQKSQLVKSANLGRKRGRPPKLPSSGATSNLAPHLGHDDDLDELECTANNDNNGGSHYNLRSRRSKSAN